MKLKKIALLLALSVSTALANTFVVSAAPNTYEVPTLMYEMTIPNGYYAMTRDSDIDNGKMAELFGAPGADFKTLLQHQIIMIDSATYSPIGEYMLAVAQSEFSTRIQNFYNKSEDYLSKEWTLALLDKKYSDFQFSDQKEAKFVHTRSSYENDMFENYITVKNGLYYMISARISGDYSAEATDSLLKRLVDSIHFTSHDVIVRIDGMGLDFAQRPMIYKDRTMVPLRAIFEALGATVEWDGNTKTVTSTKDGVEIKLQIDSNSMYKNGNAIELDAPAILYNDYTLVPVRAIAEAFNYTVDWNNNARIVDIKTN